MQVQGTLQSSGVSHLSEDPLHGVALSMMPQDKSYSSFFSFKCQMCLLSSVAFFRLLFLKDCLWPYNRFLNVPSVSPTYFFISFYIYFTVII